MEKATPRENWKDLARAVDATGLCRDGCPSDFADGLLDFYFRPHELRLLTAADSDPAEVMASRIPALLKQGRPLVMFEMQGAGEATRRLARAQNYVCLVPRQTLQAPFLLVPASRAAPLLRQGLMACDQPGP